MDSIFTRIIKKEIPCYKIAEDDNHIAFLDVKPNALGHTLCVPKQQVDKLFDLESSDYIALMGFSRKIAMALEKSVNCNRIGMSVVGLEVPHTHVHLIPINHIEDISFQKKITLTSDKFEALALKIKSHL